MFLIIYDFLFLTCILRVYANTHGMSHSALNRQNMFMPTSHLEKHWNGLSIKFLATSKFPNESNGSLKINQYSCIDSYHQNDIINEYVSDSPGYLDTLSQDDIVRNQYLLLPYPAVTQHSLALEQNHYNSSKRNKPFNTYYSMALESINHFLYKGSNDFR